MIIRKSNKSCTSDILYVWKAIHKNDVLQDLGLDLWVETSLGKHYRDVQVPEVDYILDLIGEKKSRDVFAELQTWTRWVLIYHIYNLNEVVFSEIDSLFSSTPIIVFSDDDELWDYILKINNILQKSIKRTLE